MEIKLTKPLLCFRKEVLINIMRSFIFLLCFSAFSLSPENILSQNTKILIKENKTVTVDEVFDIIMSQTDYTFIYQVDMFKSYPKVDLEKGAIKVNELLQKSLSNGRFNIDVADNKNTIVISKKADTSQQEITITGTVVDENGIPVVGATVIVSDREPGGSNDFFIRGTATDFDGGFSIKASKGDYLGISALGYERNIQQVSDQTVYNVTLKEKASDLDEVVVIGYGTAIRKDLTGSVGSVSSEDIVKVKSQTVDQALVGQVAGVFVESNAGAPGAGASVNIRGLSQILGNNQPLYVIDGIPIVVEQNFGEFGAGTGNATNPLFNIDQNNIESIDILKDASAGAIYGSRAANGVVIITTKKGRKNQAPQFNVSVNTTFMEATGREDFLSLEQYRQFAVDFGGVDPDTFFGDANTDWQDLALQNSPIWNQFNFNTSGGGKNTTYALSASFNDQDGLLIGSNLRRYNIAANIETSLNKFKVGGSVNYTYGFNKSSGLTDLSAAGRYRPDFEVFNEDGSFTSIPGFFGARLNPLGDQGRINNEEISQNLFGSLFAEFGIVENLKFTSKISVSLNNIKRSEFSPSFTSVAQLRGFNQPLQGAVLENETIDGYTSTFVNQLNYNGYIAEDHRIDAMVAISWDRVFQNTESQEYAGFPDDFILTNIQSAQGVRSFGSASIESGLNSIFGRVQYNYKDRYLATFTARSDGSIKFGPQNRRGFFPSGGIAWNLHNENFLSNVDAIDQLKLRASYGITGIDNLPAFPFLVTFETPTSFSGPLIFNGETGIVPNGVPNERIRWEENQQLDLGLEFSLFNGRLNGEIAYFDYNNNNLLLFAPVPFETGSRRFSGNVADVTNNGWEFTIGGDIARTENFRWNSSFNISFIENEVTALNNGVNSEFLGGSLRGIVEGQPIGFINGFEVIGIAQNQQQIDDLNTAAGPGNTYYSRLRAPGDYIYRDVNGDNRIDDQDLVPLGDINSDFFGGWNNSITYKNFDFNFNIQFVEGVSRLWTGSSSFNDTRVELNNYRVQVLDTWTPDNTDAFYARFGSSTHSDTNSRQVEDASYIRLRSASLGYSLPTNFINKFGFNSARISLSGNNLITITDYPGPDPESLSAASTTTERTADRGGSFPLARTFTVGLNVSF